MFRAILPSTRVGRRRLAKQPPECAMDSDPMVDEAADQLVNPRPSSKHFGSLAEREAAHSQLLHEGERATAAGELARASEYYEQAYALLFRRATLLALVHTKFQLGEAELAAACYAKVLASGIVVGTGEREYVIGKMTEARQLCAEARAIVYATQAALFNSADDRERLHRKLVERARLANESAVHADAEALFLQAVPALSLEPKPEVRSGKVWPRRRGSSDKPCPRTASSPLRESAVGSRTTSPSCLLRAWSTMGLEPAMSMRALFSLVCAPLLSRLLISPPAHQSWLRAPPWGVASALRPWPYTLPYAYMFRTHGCILACMHAHAYTHPCMHACARIHAPVRTCIQWPLLFRPSTLISAANMMARQGLTKLRLAAALYLLLLGAHWRPPSNVPTLTEDETVRAWVRAWRMCPPSPKTRRCSSNASWERPS